MSTSFIERLKLSIKKLSENNAILEQENQKCIEMILHVSLGKSLSEEEKDWIRHHLKK
jgi:hypothetical protein